MSYIVVAAVNDGGHVVHGKLWYIESDDDMKYLADTLTARYGQPHEWLGDEGKSIVVINEEVEGNG